MVAAAATAITVDRALKTAVEHSLDEGEQARGPLGVQILRRTNTGDIAGTDTVGAGASGALLAAGGVLALGIAAAGVLARRPIGIQIGTGLVAGGMFSNLADRAVSGSVTDMLPTPFGVLNGADVAIGAGILLGGIALAVRR